MLDDLQTTAFRNPDGKIAVVVMNMSDEAHPFYLWLDGKAAKTGSPAHSIMALVVSDVPTPSLAARQARPESSPEN